MTRPPGAQRAQLLRELLDSSSTVLSQRLDALEQAAAHLLAVGPLAEPARSAAQRTAHQLMALGTFGIGRGATLAAQAEALLAAPQDPPDDGARLAELVDEMREELQRALAVPDEHLDDASPPPSPQQRGRPADVLVVEDDPLLVELLKRALADIGCSVAAVGDGPAALAAVDVPPAQRPRLVLLDIDLPGLDGFGVLRALTARRLIPGVPVVCLTARASEQDVLLMLTLGAVDHVAKPFSLPVLMARVRRSLREER